MKWIRVEDEMPPDNEEAWVYDRCLGVLRASYTLELHSDGSWASYEYPPFIKHFDDVTHWQQYIEPKPSPPTAEWISVNDGLPKCAESVWVHSQSRGVLLAYFSRWEGWYYEHEDYDDGKWLPDVTYWQPIIKPESPQ